MSYTITAVICAAGQGVRAGFAKNKLLSPYQGGTVLEKTLRAFDFSLINEIVIASSEKDLEEISGIANAFPRTKVVLGGATRFQSVHNALQAVQSDIVLIHDGARPFVTRESIENCIQSIKTNGSGICAIPCVDTTARAEDGKIKEIPDRNYLYQIQTPQGFFTENIRYAYERVVATGETSFTDDSSVFAQFCGQPSICAGSRENVKLTYAEDFQGSAARCGFGVDTHAFGKSQNYIVLCGVKIPSASGLIAHSDGDVALHALMDGLLSAAGLRDIGYYFPDSDEKWREASSIKMLERVHAIVQAQGFEVKNVSIAIQAERPRLAKYIEEMQNAVAGVLKIDPTSVGISAGTNEGLGYVGEGKGITAYAYVLLSR